MKRIQKGKEKRTVNFSTIREIETYRDVSDGRELAVAFVEPDFID